MVCLPEPTGLNRRRPTGATRTSNFASGARRRCTYSQARGCRWTSPRARRRGCLTRYGSQWSRRWESKSYRNSHIRSAQQQHLTLADLRTLGLSGLKISQVPRDISMLYLLSRPKKYGNLGHCALTLWSQRNYPMEITSNPSPHLFPVLYTAAQPLVIPPEGSHLSPILTVNCT